MQSLVPRIMVLGWLAGVTPAQDNVLLLIADDLGVDSISVYAEGSSPPPTPNLDALANQGILFRNAWTNPFCSATRSTIQTGRYSCRTGVGQAFPTPDPELPPCESTNRMLSLAEMTLPEWLDSQQSGYAHALIGKWHLGGGDTGPNDAGWSHFAGLIHGFTPDYFNWQRTVDGVTTTTSTYATTQIVDDAINWVQSVPEPWVCVVAFNAPHSPFHAPPSNLHTQSLQGIPPYQKPKLAFRAMVEAMDTEIGRLLATLGPEVVGRTNVVFTGDNGTFGLVAQPPFSRYRAKGTPYEGGLNVPLIVTGPAVGGSPREEPALVSLTDLFATITELCGRPSAVPFRRMDSVSFAPLLASASATPPRTWVYGEAFDNGEPAASGFAAARDTTFKVIRWMGGGEELYDLAADPFEDNDLLRAPPLSAAAQSSYDTLTAVIDSIRDTTGNLTTYGTATCEGSNGYPKITGSGSPAIGGGYSVHLQKGPSVQPVALFVGASNQTWLGLPLPLSIGEIGGGPGCAIHASGELHGLAVTDAAGDAAVSIPLPFAPELISAPIYHTWVMADLQAPQNRLGVVTSNGLTVTVGG